MSATNLEEDRPWLDDYRRGDRAAFARILDRYLDDVACTVRAGVVVTIDGQRSRVGIGLAEHDAEALIQDTFLRAFSEAARTGYDGLRPFGAYLATIARNLVVDHGRRTLKANARIAIVDDIDHIADASVDDPGTAFERREIAAIVAAFAAGLEPMDADVFRLRYTERRSHRAVGDTLGLSEIQVRRRDERLRNALLLTLRERGYLVDHEVTIGTSLLSRRRT